MFFFNSRQGEARKLKSYLFESAWWGSADLLSQPGGWDAGKNQGQVIFMIVLGLVFWQQGMVILL